MMLATQEAQVSDQQETLQEVLADLATLKVLQRESNERITESIAGLEERIRTLIATGDVEGLEAEITRQLRPEVQAEFLSTLSSRLGQETGHYTRPEGITFADIQRALEANPVVLWSLHQMESTGGCPDIIAIADDAFIFADCSIESPKGSEGQRRNLAYDEAAEQAEAFGVDMMSQDVYRNMQKTGNFDSQTWSWLQTPAEIRKSGSALYGDRGGGGVCVGQGLARFHDDYGGWRGVLRVPKA